MNEPVLSVRELQERDIEAIANYWLNADRDFLHGMGADIEKIPPRDFWVNMLTEQINSPLEEKKSYAIIWEVDGKAIGHCNVNKIIFGEEAYMHLHIWDAEARKKGYGAALVKKTLPYFFNDLKLSKLYCEPYAHNPAPNRAVEKVGFEFIKTYTTTPGYINFEQEVNLWELTRERFERWSF